jgi:hypothetical protein
MLAAKETKSRLFRGNVGTGWTGNKITRFKCNSTVIVGAGDVLIREARPLSSGLPKGFPDLFGWTQVKITQDDVGKTLAVFIGAEIKTATGKPSDEQLAVIKAINNSGGIAGVVRSSDEFVKLVSIK